MNAFADKSKEKIRETNSVKKAIETLSKPNLLNIYPSKQLAFDQQLFNSDLIIELVEITTLENTCQFKFKHDKNSQISLFKTVSGVPLLAVL